MVQRRLLKTQVWAQVSKQNWRPNRKRCCIYLMVTVLVTCSLLLLISLFGFSKFKVDGFLNVIPSYANHRFQFIHNLSDICSTTGSAHYKPGMNLAVTLVHTARDHFKTRALLRKTYAGVRTFNNWFLPVIFLVGSGPEKDIDSKLEEEYKSFNDVLVGDFLDTYRNLTVKHLVAMQWAIEFCPHADFYVKTDDDNLIEVFLLTSLLNSIPRLDEDYYCTRRVGWSPHRVEGKYVVTLKEYPQDIYPPFCNGLYVVRMNTIRQIHWISHRVKEFWMEDVFFSGVLRECLNYELRAGGSWRTVGIVPYIVAAHLERDYDNIINAISRKNFIEISTNRNASLTCEFWNLVLDSYSNKDKYGSC